jgi:hypothetical protein
MKKATKTVKEQVITTGDIPTLLSIIPKGHTFSVLFVKVDGQARLMDCRMGVKSYLTPNPKRAKPEMPKNIVTVFDMQKKAYRHINMDTTITIKAEGTTFYVR